MAQDTTSYRGFLQAQASVGNEDANILLGAVGDDGNLNANLAGEGIVYSGTALNGSQFGADWGALVDRNNYLYEQYLNRGSSTSPSPSPTAAPAPTGGGSTTPALNQALVDNTQGSIDAIPGLLKDALAAEGTRYQNTTGGYNAGETAQQGVYDKSTTTNQLNYDANFMDSIRAGIKGLGSLKQLLRGSGAGGGTAENQARDVVGGITAQDIRGGADTQQENQASLDGSLSSYLTNLKRKRETSVDTYENNKRAINRDSNTQLQDLYGKMAGLFSDANNTAKATEWLNRSGALTPSIARDSQTQVSNYDTAPVVVKAPELTAFSGSSQPNAIQAPTNGQVGSGIFTIGDDERRRRRELPVGV